MKKASKYISMVACVFAALAFVACDKDTPSTQVPDHETSYFPIGDNIEIHPLGDVLHVSFTSDVNWEVVTPDWIKFSKPSGNKGTTKIDITVYPYYDNDSSADRNKVISFINSENGGVLKNVTFTQDAAYLKILRDESASDECSFEWKKDQTASYQIETNIDFEYVFEDGELFGLQESGKDFTLSTLDHNFGVEDKVGGLKVVPVSNGKVEIGSDIRNKLAKSVNISQDYLIFAVLEGRDVSFDDLTAEQMTGDIELAGFNELGADYAGTGAEAETVKSFSVISEVGTVEYNDLQITDDGFRLDDRGSDQYELSNGRTVLVRNYEVTRSAPNPGTDTLRCEIPVTINGFDDEGAQRKITLVQNPYTWNVTVGKLLAQDNSTTTLVIDTKGPWTVNIPEAADWWQSSVTEWQGEGYKEIVIESTKWNLDLENDWPALLEVSNSLNALRSDMTLIKEHYHFNIGENLVTDRETARTVLAELRKKDTDTYAVEVDCSGEWQAEYTLPDWVNISDLGNETLMSGNATFTLGAMTKNTEEYDRGAKIVFTSLTHQNESEPQVVTDTLYITQLKHVFGWEPDEWTDETRNQYCNQPAYIVGGGTHTFGFETTFSDTWSLSSNQDWVKFHLGNNTAGKSSYISGEGEDNDERYVYVTVDHNFNTGSSDRTATVTVRDEFKGTSKSFTISQDPFVFDVTGSSTTTVGPLEEKAVTYNIKVTEGAPWRLNLTGDTQLIASGYTGNGTGTGAAEAVTLTTRKVPEVNKTRSATVKVSVDGSTLSKTFTVKQNEYRFKVDKSSLTKFDELNPASQNFTVTSDGSFSVNAPDWVSVTYTGNVYTVTAQKNTGAERSGYVQVTLTDQGMQASPINVAVSQRDFMFNVSPTSVSAKPLTDLTHDITIASSGKWTATSSNSSFTLSKASGEGKRNSDKVTLTVPKNYTESAVSGTVTVKSSDSNHTETISISQPKYEFTTSKDNQEVASGGGSFSRSVTCTDPAAWKVTSSDNTNFTCKKDGNNKFTVTVESNEGDGKKETAERSATITVETTDASKRKIEFKVTQKGFTPKKN